MKNIYDNNQETLTSKDNKNTKEQYFSEIKMNNYAIETDLKKVNNNKDNNKQQIKIIHKNTKLLMEEAIQNIMIYVQNEKMSIVDLIKKVKIPNGCKIYYNIGGVWYSIKKHNYIIVIPNEEIIKCSIELQNNDVYKKQSDKQLMRAKKFLFTEKTHMQPLLIYLIIKYNFENT